MRPTDAPPQSGTLACEPPADAGGFTPLTSSPASKHRAVLSASDSINFPAAGRRRAAAAPPAGRQLGVSQDCRCQVGRTGPMCAKAAGP